MVNFLIQVGKVILKVIHTKRPELVQTNLKTKDWEERGSMNSWEAWRSRRQAESHPRTWSTVGGLPADALKILC